LINLKITPRLAIIVENLQTGLSFKDLKGTLLILKLGYSVDLLGELPWLKGVKAIYWGDMDTHGFAILNRARKYLPNLSSIFMDNDTFSKFFSHSVKEPEPYRGKPLSNLTASETELFLKLKENGLRLEQEKISWDTAWKLISQIADTNDN
jgi:hypothetical protein